MRFDPRFPLFDTHDIARHLKPGRNVIAVQVNYFGMKTFRAMPARGGMISWGEVRTRNGTVISLSSNSGYWRAVRSGAHLRYASRLSFALNAADLFDQSGEEEGWKEASFEDSHWPAAIELTAQRTWGALSPRLLPFMSGDEIPISQPVAVRVLANLEQWYSFSVPLLKAYEDSQDSFKEYVLFSTWLFSPKDQPVEIGVSSGDHWINGRLAPKGVPSPVKSMRSTQRWMLRQGWNYVFGRVAAYHDRIDEFFALPNNRGLVFAGERNPGPRKVLPPIEA